MTFDRQDLILELRSYQLVAEGGRTELALGGAVGALLTYLDDEQVTEAFRAIGKHGADVGCRYCGIVLDGTESEVCLEAPESHGHAPEDQS